MNIISNISNICVIWVVSLFPAILMTAFVFGYFNVWLCLAYICSGALLWFIGKRLMEYGEKNPPKDSFDEV